MPNFQTKEECGKFLSGLIEKHQERMEYLYDRWQDEKEYEDWNEYQMAMKGMFGDLFVRAMKRPFCAVIRIGIRGVDKEIKITVNSRSVGWSS